MGNINTYGFATKAVHVGEEPNFSEGSAGDVVSPIHLSTTFARKKVDEPTLGYDYTRSLNPTRKALEEKLVAFHLRMGDFYGDFKASAQVCAPKNRSRVTAGD